MTLPDQIASGKHQTGNSAPSVAEAGGGADFFIPPLCNVPALSLLIIMGELVAVVLLLGRDQPSWEAFAVISLFVQWNVLVATAMLCWLRDLLARLPLVWGASLSFVAILLINLALTLLGHWWVNAPSELSAWTLTSNVLVGAIVGGIVLRYFFVQQQLQAQREAELRARLQALQSRIRPHFLFNSMNIIASLIATDPDAAETVVEDLSQLFRASLNESTSLVPIHHEIDLCKRYLRIEGMRLDERLRVHWHLEPLPEGIQIPLLTLQPLLENAIYHGIQPRAEGGDVHVLVQAKGEELEIVVRNPLPIANDRIEPPTSGNRMAMTNIRSRLQVLYGNDASLDARQAGTEYVVVLRYPWRRQHQAMVEPSVRTTARVVPDGESL